jgi:Leucine-rich repeat (LRR) protein
MDRKSGNKTGLPHSTSAFMSDSTWAAKLIDESKQYAIATLQAKGATVDIHPLANGRTSASVDLTKSNATDDDLKLLDQIDNLFALQIASGGITDTGLRRIASLDSLLFLTIKLLPVNGGVRSLTGKSLDHVPTKKLTNFALWYHHPMGALGKLGYDETRQWAIAIADRFRGLESITCGFCALDDEALAALATISSLKKLDLSFSQIKSRAGFQQLAKLAQLGELTLSGTKVVGPSPDSGGLNAECFNALQRLPYLYFLDLQNTNSPFSNYIDANALPALVKMTNLRVLDLSGNRLTNEAVDELASMTNLVFLGLEKMQLPPIGLLSRCWIALGLTRPRGIAWVRRQLPDLAAPTEGVRDKLDKALDAVKQQRKMAK